MKLAALSFLAALVAAPLAAQGAQPPARWAATLSGRIVETYSYTASGSEADCQISRLGTTTRELALASRRSTIISVARSGARAVYRPARLSRVRLSTTAGGGEWRETRRCRAAPIERSAGQCSSHREPARLIRPSFRRTGANRISFRGPTGAGSSMPLCGLQRIVIPAAVLLNLAPGLVDELSLIRGSRARVFARGELTREQELPGSDAATRVSQTLRIFWTLRLRRLG